MPAVCVQGPGSTALSPFSGGSPWVWAGHSVLESFLGPALATEETQQGQARDAPGGARNQVMTTRAESPQEPGLTVDK